MLRKLIYVK